MNKNLIVYFCGNSQDVEVIASSIHEMFESTLFEVETIVDYPKDHQQCINIARKELKQHIRPKILDYVHHFEEYHAIILVYPNWCSAMPMALFTFLELHPLTNQVLIPVIVGGYKNHSYEDIKKLYPETKIEKGLIIKDKNQIQEIKEYLINLI